MTYCTSVVDQGMIDDHPSVKLDRGRRVVGDASTPAPPRGSAGSAWTFLVNIAAFRIVAVQPSNDHGLQAAGRIALRPNAGYALDQLIRLTVGHPDDAQLWTDARGHLRFALSEHLLLTLGGGPRQYSGPSRQAPNPEESTLDERYY